MNTQTEITEKIIALATEFTEDWGLDEEITPQTKFNDELGFSSIDMMHYLAVIDMEFRKKFPFEQLIMNGGIYRNELTVEELATFLYKNKDVQASQPKAV
jgi:acyl carrier protein